MPQYRAYGLTIDSNLPLPELISSPTGADVVIRLTTIAPKPPPSSNAEPTLLIELQSVTVTYPTVGTFRVRDGSVIEVDLLPSAGPADAHPIVTGPLLGILLHQRGQVVLHASCVALNGSAVCFLAPSTGGKSTMASVLCERGFALLADDITALDAEVRVQPAYPRLKLWMDAVELLGHQPDLLPRVHPADDKRVLDAQTQFANVGHALRQIYVLAEGDAVAIERLSPREAMMELLGQSYCANLSGYVADPAYFQKCAALARTIPTYRLTRPFDLQVIRQVAAQVEDNLRAEWPERTHS